jgi:steroid delta-isomerase-like uncharacterized protein
MSPDYAALVRRWFEEVWNQRRAQTVDELLTAESVCHLEDGDITGPQEFRQRVVEPFLAAFPDLRVTVEGVLADGDAVAVRWSAAGTHRGDRPGVPPTGRAVSFRGLTWVRVREGQLLEAWQSSNIPEVVRGLAARPPT